MDAQLLLFLNSYHTVWLDSFMWSCSRTTTWWFILLVLLYVIFKNNTWQQALRLVLCISLCILLADQLSSSLIKPLVCRLRPTHDPQLMNLVNIVHNYRGGLYGFCSSHAANCFAVTTFLSFLFRHRILTVTLFLWATIVSFSRIYLAVHFPGDVLCGALLGMSIGFLVYNLHERFMHNDSQKYYSSAYTPTGYLVSDINNLIFSFVATFLFLLIFY